MVHQNRRSHCKILAIIAWFLVIGCSAQVGHAQEIRKQGNSHQSGHAAPTLDETAIKRTIIEQFNLGLNDDEKNGFARVHSDIFIWAMYRLTGQSVFLNAPPTGGLGWWKWVKGVIGLGRSGCTIGSSLTPPPGVPPHFIPYDPPAWADDCAVIWGRPKITWHLARKEAQLAKQGLMKEKCLQVISEGVERVDDVTSGLCDVTDGLDGGGGWFSGNFIERPIR